MKCSANTAKGHPCKAHAIKDSQPPLCSAHSGRTVGAGAPADNQNRREHGFYGRVYTLQEIADLVRFADDSSLEDEIAVARVATRRVMEQLQKHNTEPNTPSYADLAALAFTGANTVARLLRTQRVLTGETADGIAGAIAQALDEIGSELDVDL